MTAPVPSSGLSAARVEEIEATFEKVPMTPEQKLAEAVASVQGEIEKIEEELREGEDSDNDEEIHHLAGQSIWADHLRTVLSALASAREATAQAVRDDRLSQERVWEAIRAAYVAGVAGALRFKEREDRKPFHYGRAAKAHATRTIEEMLARSLPGETADA